MAMLETFSATQHAITDTTTQTTTRKYGFTHAKSPRVKLSDQRWHDNSKLGGCSSMVEFQLAEIRA